MKSHAALRRVTVVLAILMAVYVGFAWWAVHRRVADSIPLFPLSVFPATLGCVALGIVLRILRWNYFVRRLGWPVSGAHSALAFVASLAFTATPGKAGEAFKSVLLQTVYDIPIANGVAVLVVERLGDLIAVLLLSIGGIGLVTGTTNLVIVTTLIVLVATLVIGNDTIRDYLLIRIARVGRLRGIAESTARAFSTCKPILRPGTFLVGVSIAIAAWGCEAYAFQQLAHSVGIDIGVLQASSIYGVATLAGVLSALPGGIGGFEVSMVLMLDRVTSTSLALPVVVIFRLCTLWFGILLGAIGLLIWYWSVGPVRPIMVADRGEMT